MLHKVNFKHGARDGKHDDNKKRNIQAHVPTLFLDQRLKQFMQSENQRKVYCTHINIIVTDLAYSITDQFTIILLCI